MGKEYLGQNINGYLGLSPGTLYGKCTLFH